MHIRSLRRSALATVVLAGLTLSPPMVASDSDWLPEPVRDAVAQELIQRMQPIETGPEIDPEERFAAARRGVDDIVERLDSWGLDGLLDRSPDISALDFPPTRKAIPAAIGRWGACSLGLYEELAENDEQLFYIALSNVSVMMVSAYFRHAYLEDSGTDDELKVYLTSNAFAAIEAQMAENPDLRGEVNEQCGPALSALLGP